MRKVHKLGLGLILVVACASGILSLAAPGGQFCGGIAGIQCPEGFKCVDIPGDGCNPNQGGADCPGRCKRSR